MGKVFLCILEKHHGIPIHSSTKRSHWKNYLFFSNDGRFPVNEEACSAQTLQAELASRQINHVALGLFALGDGQYGVYAETKTAMN